MLSVISRFFYIGSVIIVGFFLKPLPDINLAHSGKGSPPTDQNGCHLDRQGRRHCHFDTHVN